MTLVGRAQFNHPALATAGGSALHLLIETMWTATSDHLSFRYFTMTLANGATSSALTHNFGITAGFLKFLVFESATQRTDAQVAADYVIATSGANAFTIQNVSGGSKTFQILVFAGKLGVNSADFDPAVSITTTGNIRALELRTTGEDIVINHDAAASGADWKGTLRRPSSGMTAAAIYTLPTGTTTLLGNDQVQVVTNKDIDGGTASNTSRITLPKAAVATLTALTRKAGTVVFGTDTLLPYYDNGSSLLPMAAFGGGGGSGGGSWAQHPDGSPIETQLANEKAFLFSDVDTGTQKLVLFIKVPSSYVAGRQIVLALSTVSPSTANAMGFTTNTYLIRPGTEAAASTANVNANTQQVNNAAPTLVMQEHVMQLTNASGQVNSIAVAAGNVLRVELQRASDTDTADIYVLPSLTEMRVL